MRRITGCIAMNNISFDNVWMLLIAAPLALVFLVPFFISVRKENRNGHNIASIAMHLIMAVLIAFAAAGTTFTAVLTETQVYVVADVSYSADKNLDTVDAYIKNLKLPKNSKIGLVCFGNDCEVVSEPVRQSDIPSVKTAQVDNSQTNIAEALEYTGELFDDGVIKRVVLITDAKQTDQSDTYAIRRAVDALEAQNVRVDAIYLDDNISEEVREVQITDVEYTNTAYKGREEIATVTVESSYDTDEATLTLYKNGELCRSSAPELTAGANAVAVRLDTDAAGVFDYELTLSAPEDKSDRNNTYTFRQVVSDSINILAVTGDWGTATAILEKYGGRCNIDLYENVSNIRLERKGELVNSYAGNDKVHIYDFLSGMDRDNGYIDVRDVPWTVEELANYDEIILADVNITDFLSAGEFINNLDTVVSTFGKTLTTYGNLGIQESDDENLAALGSMLPVQYGKSDDSRLYAIVIDSSYSMNYNSHFFVAKQVATRLAGLLSEGDQICVVTFYGDARLVIQPTDASNQAIVTQAINDLAVQQGTMIGSGLRNAYNVIKDLVPSYSQTQVMLISDGATFEDERQESHPNNPVKVVTEMYDAQIATSVFDVGRKQNGLAEHGQLLESIAAAGGGNYYESDNSENLSDELFSQIADDEVEFSSERESNVRVNRGSDEVLGDIDVRAIPQISGFMLSRQKASATTVLQAEYKKTENSSARAVPLYSYWDYGNGKVNSFTSRFAGDWVKNWSSAGVDGIFLNNVLETGLPEEKFNYPFVFSVEKGEGYTSVRLVPATTRFNATATVEITKPGGEKINESFAFNQYYYYYDFASAEAGEYDISVTYNYYDMAYSVSRRISIPYTDEYNEFASYDPSVLYRALNGRGEVSVNGELELVNKEQEMGTYAIALTIPLLIICVALYVADIVVRKLKWNDVVSFFGAFRKSGGEKT